MDGEGAGEKPGAVSGDGAPTGADGGAGGGSGGQPPKPGTEGGAGGAFDRGKLHPALRDMPPEQITELFETMAAGLRGAQAKPGEPDYSGIPAHARPAPEPKAPEPIAKETYKELLDPSSEKFDPEKAFSLYAEKNYGRLFGDVNLRSIKGMFGQFRDQLPDFKDFEQEVTESLQAQVKAGKQASQMTEGDVLNTYFLVKGARTTLKERQAAASKSATTLAPSAAEPAKKTPELSELEVEVANRMFRRIPDPAKRLEEYKKFAGYDEGGMTMKVPVGGGKNE